MNPELEQFPLEVLERALAILERMGSDEND